MRFRGGCGSGCGGFKKHQFLQIRSLFGDGVEDVFTQKSENSFIVSGGVQEGGEAVYESEDLQIGLQKRNGKEIVLKVSIVR